MYKGINHQQEAALPPAAEPKRINITQSQSNSLENSAAAAATLEISINTA